MFQQKRIAPCALRLGPGMVKIFRGSNFAAREPCRAGFLILIKKIEFAHAVFVINPAVASTSERR